MGPTTSQGEPKVGAKDTKGIPTTPKNTPKESKKTKVGPKHTQGEPNDIPKGHKARPKSAQPAVMLNAISTSLVDENHGMITRPLRSFCP